MTAVADPKKMNLTFEYLTSIGGDPLAIGRTWALTLTVKLNGVAQNISGWTFTMSIWGGETTITRKTGVTSAGAPQAQAVIATQSGATLGQVTFYFDAITEDITSLQTVYAEGTEQALAGARGRVRLHYDISYRQEAGANDPQRTLAQGLIDIINPCTVGPITA